MGPGICFRYLDASKDAAKPGHFTQMIGCYVDVALSTGVKGVREVPMFQFDRLVVATRQLFGLTLALERSEGLFEEGEQEYALDNLCNSAGPVVVGSGHIVYVGWVHSHPAGPCGDRPGHPPASGPQSCLARLTSCPSATRPL